MSDKRTRADLLHEIEQLKARLAQLESVGASRDATYATDESRFRQLLDSLPVTVFIYQDKQVVYLNSAGHHLCGHDLKQVILAGFWHVIHPDSIDTLKDVFRQANRRETFQIRLDIKAYDVNHQLSVLDVMLVSISYHQQPSLLGAVVDVTERIHAHEQRLALDAEKERVKVLTDFVRDVGHDFRTPLSTINTSIYLLGRVDDPIKRQQQLNILRDQVRHLDKLVDALLTMSRLDSGLMDTFKTFDLNLVIIEAIHSVDALSHEKKQLIKTTLKDGLPPIEGDIHEIHRAMRELILNAVQYTSHEGEIEIQTQSTEHEVIITVQDTGYGIAPDDLPHIFDRFFRADQARSIGGVGLGLSIVRKVIEHHHGRIDVLSQLHHGTTFIIHLPIYQPSEEQ
ncbi:MAG: PAS domain-containing sensor histidine kinase [Anaerolineae bacterium]|jgi:PAS domain S-box-containing protein|nr:PAS domain-containing sensor histidine kinase [Anaerolineae bacterium]